MKAVTISEFGGPEKLEIGNIARPSPNKDEILIKIMAAGINRPDIIQRNGKYPPPAGASHILGLECSGTIIEIGKNVTEWKIGTPVCALLTGGGYAEFAVAHKNLCLKIPKSLDFISSAGLPETFFTVYSNIFDRGKLKKNETLLIHGGTSGIGTTAIQMAKAFGAKVITTSGSDDKCDFCKKLGADHVINYKKQNFLDEIMKYTTNQGVDVILDMVAGDYSDQNIKCLKEDGRLVIIAVQKGPNVNLNILPVMLKRLTITGSTLRPRDNIFKADITRKLQKHIWPLIEEGKIKPVIDKIFDMDHIKSAHEYMEKGNHMGKIIIKIKS